MTPRLSRWALPATLMIAAFALSACAGGMSTTPNAQGFNQARIVGASSAERPQLANPNLLPSGSCPSNLHTASRFRRNTALTLFGVTALRVIRAGIPTPAKPNGAASSACRRPRRARTRSNKLPRSGRAHITASRVMIASGRTSSTRSNRVPASNRPESISTNKTSTFAQRRAPTNVRSFRWASTSARSAI